MIFGTEDVFSVLNNNFNYPIVNTCAGKAIAMNPYDAFIYANVTGSAYLNNITFPFSPKGLMKIFYNAFDYNFVTGLFDNLSFKYTPLNIKKLYPFVAHNTKYILPIEFNSEKELYNELRVITTVILENKMNPLDFIVQRIEAYKKGRGMEPFLEYIACEFFKRKGYVVENQVPLTHTVGSPDFAGYKTAEFLAFASSTKKLPLGFHIFELAMIKAFNKTHEYIDLPKSQDIIVGEAKTSVSNSAITAQLFKYLDTGLFNEGYEINPLKQAPSSDEFGLLTFSDNHIIIVAKPKENFRIALKKLDISAYSHWLNNYFKFYLLSNLTTDQLEEFSYAAIGRHISNTNDLVALVENCTFIDIADKVMG